MTRMEVLRDYLDRQGFAIREERMVRTDRIYQIICAEFDGEVRSHSPLTQLLGQANMQRRDELCLSLAKRQRDQLNASRAGKLKGSTPDTSREDTLLAELAEFLSDETEESTI
jgi:tRNA A22 N-methylase